MYVAGNTITANMVANITQAKRSLPLSDWCVLCELELNIDLVIARVPRGVVSGQGLGQKKTRPMISRGSAPKEA